MGNLTAYISRSLLMLALLFLAACTGTSTLYSKTLVKPTQTITDLRVLYVENKLVTNKLERNVDFGKNRALASIGYDDLPELLKERAPIVFGLNGVTTSYATTNKVANSNADLFTSIQWSDNTKANSPLLVIQVVDGSMQKYQSTTNFYLNMNATLFESKSNLRLWTGQFQNMLSIAALGGAVFDNGFADNMLKIILDQMAQDGIVKLKGGRAVVPDERR